MSVDWVLNNSKYEISSKNHLLQLMSNGTLFSDTGTPPTNYWSSDYIQTDDIDLESDGNISPIGSSTNPFTGSYDGSGFSITDWVHTTSDPNAGFFGYASAALIQNINMEGSWVLSASSQCGFLVGEVESSNIYNVTADFSSGSIASSGTNVGGLLGTASGSIMEGLTMKGVLSSISGTTNVGGIVGSMTNGSSLNYVRNMVRFTDTTAISGTSCAGVCSHVSNSSCTYIMNAVIGSITGTDDAGGIFSTIENTSTNSISHVINSMTGSISSTGVSSGSAGGIASTVQSDGNSVFSMDSLANYSSGSISGTNDSGGIVGSITDGVVILNSVIAMNGTVEYAGVQTYTGTNNSVQVQIINTFGLVHTNPGVDVSLTALTGSFGMHSGFSDLEYFAMEGVDSIGNNFSWEFVFANASGSVEYSQYSHIVISSSDVCAPITLETNLQDNSIEYVYFMNLGSNEVVTSPGLMIAYSSGLVFDTSGSALYPVPPLVMTMTSPFSVDLSWEQADGSVGYKVHYGLTSIGSLDRSVTTESTNVSIMNLDASTQYTFQVYSSTDGSIFVLEDGITGSATTLTNTASSYLLSRFLVDDVYDLSGFSPDKTSQISSIIGELLGQDESILMRVDGQIRELLVAGVSGSVLDIQDGDQYILPFNASDGSAQSMVIEGVYEGFLAYNELDDSVTIDGQEYFAGDSIVVGDVRITLNSV